jgi:outer membrane protein with beta-barrel domain
MRSLFALVVVLALAPAEATAQPASTPPPLPSRLWLTAGGASATLRGDCQTCETDYPYRHGGSVLGNAGYRVNHRMDVGGEVFWVPVSTAQGTIRTTHFDAVAQFRPWASQGFFMKGGAGMAYVRNWVDTISAESINSKALSVVVGAGWEFRPLRRIGFQAFGSQHVAALGDLITADGDVPDVVGNFWSIGGAIVIR